MIKINESSHGKYKVVDGNLNVFSTNDPLEAIKVWGEKQSVTPLDVSINAYLEDLKDLFNFASRNKEEVRRVLEESGALEYYKWDYISRGIDNPNFDTQIFDVDGEPQTNFVDPFSVG